MNVCPKFKGMCVDEAGMRFVDCGGDCERCAANGGLSITFSEWEDLYTQYQTERKYCRPSTIKTNIHALRAFIRTMKLSVDAKVSIVTKEMLKDFFETYDAKPNTCKTMIEDIRKMASEGFREWCKARGKHIDALPSVNGLKVKLERYKPVSQDSRKILGDILFEYKNLEDPRKWMVLMLALKHGWSKADILRAVWSDFASDKGVAYLTKARNKTGKLMAWVVDDDDMREWKRVEQIMRSTKKFCARRSIGRYEDSLFRIPIAPKDASVTSAIVNEVNAELRRRIPEWSGTSKALHNCRKEFASTVCHTYGWDAAESATGDTTNVLRKYYVGKKELDFSQLKGIKY